MSVSITEALQIGLKYHQEGNLAEAENVYTQILQAFPDVADAWNLLGLVQMNREAYEKALLNFDNALKLDPQAAMYHINRGEALRKTGNLKDAERALREAVSLEEENQNAYYNLANILKDSHQHEEAIETYVKALTLNPSDVDSHYNLGNAYQNLDRHEAALRSYEEALKYHPHHPPTLNNMAHSLRAVGEHEQAVSHYQLLMKLNPNDPAYPFNLGNIYNDLAQENFAREHYAKALHIDPGYAPAHLNLSFLHLRAGDLESGWKGYEWRLKTFTHNPHGLAPLWDGEALESLREKSILVYHEQGYGDTVMMSRFIPALAAQVGACHLLVQPALKRLFQDSLLGEMVVDDLPTVAYDLALPVNSIPLLLGIAESSQLAPIAFLNPDREKSLRFQKRFFETEKQKVGIVWRSDSNAEDAADKSALLKDFEALIDRKAIQLYSLQKGGGASLSSYSQIIDLDSAMVDFSDTVALISQLDAVVSIDTAVAHLAGTLGIESHILLHEHPEWRWADGIHTPWYPEIQLYRCDKKRGFGALIGDVLEKLDQSGS